MKKITSLQDKLRAVGWKDDDTDSGWRKPKDESIYYLSPPVGKQFKGVRSISKFVAGHETNMCDFYLPGQSLEVVAQSRRFAALLHDEPGTVHTWIRGDGKVGAEMRLFKVSVVKRDANGTPLRVLEHTHEIHVRKAWDRSGAYHRRIQKKWGSKGHTKKVIATSSHYVLVGPRLARKLLDSYQSKSSYLSVKFVPREEPNEVSVYQVVTPSSSINRKFR